MKKLLILAGALFFPLTSQALTVNLVSDIHAGNSARCGDFVCVPQWQDSFQEFLDETEGLIISVGDNTDVASKSYAAQLRQMTSGRDVLWANGNHDSKVYVGGSKHYAVNKDDWRIVVVDYKNCGQKDIKWVKNALSGYKEKKVAAVLHYPIFTDGTTKVKKDCKKIEKVFRDYKVDYVFSGHKHGDFWTKQYKGVTYQAIEGLTHGSRINYKTMELD